MASKTFTVPFADSGDKTAVPDPTQPAGAVNIVLTFDANASDSPTFDPTGTSLVAIMGAVETYWQDIIEASGTLNVTYYYDDLDDPDGVLADHLNQGTSGGKPTDCRRRS